MSDFVFNPIPPPVLPLDDDSAQEIAALLPLPLLPLPLPLDEGDEKEEKEVEHDEEAEEEVLPTRPLKEERSWCCAQDDDIFVLFKPCSSSFEELVSLGSFYLCGRFKKKKKICHACKRTKKKNKPKARERELLRASFLDGIFCTRERVRV